jgi:hypothetical protein
MVSICKVYWRAKSQGQGSSPPLNPSLPHTPITSGDTSLLLLHLSFRHLSSQVYDRRLLRTLIWHEIAFNEASLEDVLTLWHKWIVHCGTSGYQTGHRLIIPIPATDGAGVPTNLWWMHRVLLRIVVQSPCDGMLMCATDYCSGGSTLSTTFQKSICLHHQLQAML